MKDVLTHINSRLQDGQTVILITVIRSQGSTPRNAGARMALFQDGSSVGTVGGGFLEGRCVEEAKELFLEDRRCIKFHFSFSADSAAKEGMVCGGNVDVLLQKVDPSSSVFFMDLQQKIAAGASFLMGTIIPDESSGTPQMIFDENQLKSELGEDAERVLEKAVKTPTLVVFNSGKVFVEQLSKSSTVHLIGGGHVALATAEVAMFAGFEVTVTDDRKEFANRELYPNISKVHVVDSFENCLPKLGDADYLVIVTRGHLYDKTVLAQALKSGAGYIGMIGSRKKRSFIYEKLKNEGFSQEELDCVCCPVGLDIGAESPNEIAISIVAELIQVRSKKKCDSTV